jgi:Tfp pilus assembly protein PilF
MNYFQEEEYNKAVIEFKNVIQIDPDQPTIRYHMAVSLKGLKRFDAAKEELRRAINTKEKFPELKEARRLLEELW